MLLGPHPLQQISPPELAQSRWQELACRASEIHRSTLHLALVILAVLLLIEGASPRSTPRTDASPDPLPIGYREVDATAPDKIIRCLNCLQSMAAGVAYKERALDALALKPGDPALDVACGQGDAAALPFADGSFAAVRIDRAFQHIAGQGRVVRERARVARRGAVVLCAEPDWGTFLLGGRHSPVSERIQHNWIRSFQNP